MNSIHYTNRKGVGDRCTWLMNTIANELWIVSVGDMKPMEFPISFFLDYVWNPGEWTGNRSNFYFVAELNVNGDPRICGDDGRGVGWR